jgi:hypothetical protein
MAASGDSTRLPADLLETAESDDERKKIQAAPTELVDGSNTATGQKQQQRTMAADAAVREGCTASPAEPTIDIPPLPLRCPPFPKSGKRKAVREWNLECKRISKLAAKGCF